MEQPHQPLSADLTWCIKPMKIIAELLGGLPLEHLRQGAASVPVIRQKIQDPTQAAAAKAAGFGASVTNSRSKRANMGLGF